MIRGYLLQLELLNIIKPEYGRELIIVKRNGKSLLQVECEYQKTKELNYA